MFNPWLMMAILYTCGVLFGLAWMWLCGGFEEG